MDLSPFAASTFTAASTATVAVALTWFGCKRWYGPRLTALKAAVAKQGQSLAVSSEKQAGLLAQVAALRAELREQKELVSRQQKETKTQQRADPLAEVKAMNELFFTSRTTRGKVDFEDTQIFRNDSGA